jgi:glyoxylase-like metal-dependent hydrolase (beta-lactamase superfamily II)
MQLNEIIALNGNTQLLDGGAMFGNAPKEMWKTWTQVDESNRIPLACRCLLIKKDGKNLLFETGVGSFFEPKLKERFGIVEQEHILLKSLKEHGLVHEQIDAVILSHLHFDHAGGTLSSYEDGSELQLLFPNAKYYVGKEHWLRAKNPHARDKASFIPLLNELLEKSNRLVLVEKNGVTDLAPFVTFHFSDGHTPGLMLAEICLEEGPLVFVSDLIPGCAWVHVPLSMGYDRYPELVIDEKKELLNDLIKRNGKIFFTHDVHCAVGKVCQDAKGKFFVESLLPR